jgi:hypothetical protein
MQALLRPYRQTRDIQGDLRYRKLPDAPTLSIFASIKSVTLFFVSRQCIVSVDANVPFSKILFDGVPPPQTGKYLQLTRHSSIPFLIWALILCSVGEFSSSANECS